MGDPIYFKLPEEAVEYAQHLLEAPEIPDEVSQILKSTSSSRSLDLPEMIKVFEWRCETYKKKNDEKDSYSAYPLLQKASIVLPTLPEKKRNHELQERLKRLAARQENKAYDKMVENVAHKGPAVMKRKKSSSVISGFNFALTLFASCGASMYLLRSVVPDLAFRAGIGLVIGTIILMIEIYLAVREIEKQDKKKK